MKVAVITQYFPTSAQPWAGHSAYQTLRLLAARCDLQVFYPEARYPAPLAPKTRGAALDPDWNPPEVRATYVPYPVLPVVSRPLNGWTMASRLLPHVRRFAPEILLNYVVYPDGFAAVRLGRALRVPAVLTAIGSDLNRIPDRLVGRLTRKALREADFVTTVSHDLARTAVRLGARPERVRALLNGCDTAIFHPRDRAAAREALGVDQATEAIVYVGRLDVRKGLMELVEAVSILRRSRPAVHCYAIGDGPDRPLVVEAIRKHGVEDAMTLVASCPTDQVAQWMGAADLVTLPSYREGCPNVVVEGLAAGRPVVATDVGGIPELMDETSGRLVPPMDVAALVRGLDETLGQRWDAGEIAGRHSRSWGDVAADLYSVLERTLAPSA